MLRRSFIAAFAATAILAALPASSQTGSGTGVATFGSGCFWCTESDFDKVAGVISTTSGYTGGSTPNPTYQAISTGRTGHAEVVRIVFDPAKVTYQQLLDVYWRNVDPFDGRGQFCDKGSQYRPVIYVHDAEQKKLAEDSKAQKAKELAERFKFPIAVTIEDAKPFTAAEEYHQDFHKKNPSRYSIYRTGCGRDARLRQIWGAPATN
jgi:peptide-methionine (S)-S-oxide reductase